MDTPADDLSVGVDPLTLNGYTYVNGNPVNLADPDGHLPVLGGEQVMPVEHQDPAAVRQAAAATAAVRARASGSATSPVVASYLRMVADVQAHPASAQQVALWAQEQQLQARLAALEAKAAARGGEPGWVRATDVALDLAMAVDVAQVGADVFTDAGTVVLKGGQTLAKKLLIRGGTEVVLTSAELAEKKILTHELEKLSTKELTGLLEGQAEKTTAQTATRTTARIEEKAANAETRGGVYTLRDEAGNVVRTGRSKNLAARETAHANDPVLGDYQFNPEYRTDVYAEQRGLEQMLYDQYPEAQAENGGFNKIRGISRSNPNLDFYMQSAWGFLERMGLG